MEERKFIENNMGLKANENEVIFFIKGSKRKISYFLYDSDKFLNLNSYLHKIKASVQIIQYNTYVFKIEDSQYKIEVPSIFKEKFIISLVEAEKINEVFNKLYEIDLSLIKLYWSVKDGLKIIKNNKELKDIKIYLLNENKGHILYRNKNNLFFETKNNKIEFDSYYEYNNESFIFNKDNLIKVYIFEFDQVIDVIGNYADYLEEFSFISKVYLDHYFLYLFDDFLKRPKIFIKERNLDLLEIKTIDFNKYYYLDTLTIFDPKIDKILLKKEFLNELISQYQKELLKRLKKINLRSKII